MVSEKFISVSREAETADFCSAGLDADGQKCKNNCIDKIRPVSPRWAGARPRGGGME